MIRPSRQEGTGGCLWKQIVVLPLCVCLLAAGNVQGAENQVLSVGASEAERLRELLSGERINAFLADGSYLEGRVKEIQDSLLTVDIKKSTGPSPVPRGLQDIPTDRISTVQFTRYKGPKVRLLIGTILTIGGLALGAVLTSEKFNRAGNVALVVGSGVGMGILGYRWGKEMDERDVTLVIQQLEASGGPLK